MSHETSVQSGSRPAADVVTNQPHVLRLDATDNVAVALALVPRGAAVVAGELRTKARQKIRFGHKIALLPIRKGEVVRKYGETIGVATQDIAAGDYVHVHNVASIRLPGRP